MSDVPIELRLIKTCTRMLAERGVPVDNIAYDEFQGGKV
jgi:hypothetical protein